MELGSRGGSLQININNQIELDIKVNISIIIDTHMNICINAKINLRVENCVYINIFASINTDININAMLNDTVPVLACVNLVLPATLPLLLDSMPDNKVIDFIDEVGKIRQSSKLVERFMKEVSQIKLVEDSNNSWKSNSKFRI